LVRSVHYALLIVDIRDLISLEDVMEELDMGPNGGLIYCFEYLANNLEWLDEQLGGFDNDYLLIDLPGQIELYTHHSHILPPILSHLRIQHGYALCATYLLESQFVLQPDKFFAGCLSAMSAMIMLECSHINVLSKYDLVKEQIPRGRLKQFLRGDPLVYDEAKGLNLKFHRLNEAIVKLVEDFGMIELLPLDASDRDTVEAILSYIDDCTQWAEDQEPKEPKEFEGDFDLEAED
jgi:GPN-loop GTPase